MNQVVNKREQWAKLVVKLQKGNQGKILSVPTFIQK